MIGERVKQKREERGWSQRQFAVELKANGLSVDATAVSRIENDERDLRVSELLIVALTLDSPAAWVLTGYTPDRTGYENGYENGYVDGLSAVQKAIEGLAA